MSSDRCCVMFTKPARPGKVKTRLIGALTATEAAELHRAFTRDLLSRLRDRDFDLQVAWALGEGDAPPFEASASFRQEGADLGARLFNGLHRVSLSYSKVAAVGSDHPEIPVTVVDEAFEQLEHVDVVLGPARDGGYYLIGVRSDRLSPRLFQHVDWSTERVLEQTLESCRRLGLQASLLVEGTDVDSPEDLRRLTRFLSTGVHDCPQTERLLRTWGMLP